MRLGQLVRGGHKHERSDEPCIGCGVKKSSFMRATSSYNCLISSMTGCKSGSTSLPSTLGNLFLKDFKSWPLPRQCKSSISLPSHHHTLYNGLHIGETKPLDATHSLAHHPPVEIRFVFRVCHQPGKHLQISVDADWNTCIEPTGFLNTV